MNLNKKKVFLAPHTPKTSMLKKALLEEYHKVEILGFIDKEKKGENLFKIEAILNEEFDYILVLSPNHFEFIYLDYIKKINKKKIVKIEVIDEQYKFFDYSNIQKNRIKEFPKYIKKFLFKKFIYMFDKVYYKRKELVFVSQSFISTNNKMLYLYCIQNNIKATILTDNLNHLKTLEKNSLSVVYLNSLYAYYLLAKAKVIIQDQGNSNHLIKYLSTNQTTIQLWHGLPLKRMNKLVDVIYDYHISTSDFINKTSLGEVIQAKEHLDYGYCRNDLLIKEHTPLDLLLIDELAYNIAKENNVIVYMPTHRESSPSFKESNKIKIPLDFKRLNNVMKKNSIYFILKLHPFLQEQYNYLKDEEIYTNIIIHECQGDIYPLLKYTDILLTDYSSVYYDFLLTNKPIIFFDYDCKEYEANINGFAYDYESFTPGKKVQNQDSLEEEIIKTINKKDEYILKREKLREKLFTYSDSNSSKRIVENLIKKVL